jgi:hypothetical protein
LADSSIKSNQTYRIGLLLHCIYHSLFLSYARATSTKAKISKTPAGCCADAAKTSGAILTANENAH